MTQDSQPPLPPPGGPPVGYAAPRQGPFHGDPLAPARKAGLMMIILGCLGMACGVCSYGTSTLPFEQLATQGGRPLNLPPGMTLDMVRTVLKFAGFMAFFAGVAELVLGFLVRRGGRVTAVVAIVFSTLVVGWVVINVAFSLIQAPQNIAGLVLGLLMAGLFVAQIVLLVRTYQAAPFIEQSQAVYQQQYTHYLAQQQAYQQQYGVAAPAAYPTAPPTYAPPGYHTPPAGAAPDTAQTGWQWQPPTVPLPPPPREGNE